MKLLTKAHSSQRRLIEILRVIDEADKPIGARAISDALSNRGYELGERAVRYNLKILDELGFTAREGYSGRVLTPLGTRELSDALVNDRIGFVNTRIEEYMYRTTFDPTEGRGNVVANMSIIKKEDYEAAANVMRRVFDAGYTISSRVLVLDEGDEAGTEIPTGCLGIITLCSITLDGMIMKQGIPVNTSFAGIVEIRDGRLGEFSDLIAYAGSSLDPMKILMARRMTLVLSAVQTGYGKILANVREVPIAAADRAREILDRASCVGLKDLVTIGEPGEPTLGCPVGQGKVGIALCAGINPTVAIDESGIQVRNIPISLLVDYTRMKELS